MGLSGLTLDPKQIIQRGDQALVFLNDIDRETRELNGIAPIV